MGRSRAVRPTSKADQGAESADQYSGAGGTKLAGDQRHGDGAASGQQEVRSDPDHKKRPAGSSRQGQKTIMNMKHLYYFMSKGPESQWQRH